ncbi:hypothetical protein WJX77_000013 [Trebouxia sp. C0004]
MTMKAVVYKKFGPDVLQLVEHPLPKRSAGEVLVKIKCTSVNPVDYKIRNGIFPYMAKKEMVPMRYGSVWLAVVVRVMWPTPCSHTQILGGDLAGVAESADADSKFTYGDRVFALSPDWIFTSKWGCYAEYATIKSSLLASIPDTMSFEQAAALPLVSVTAMQVAHPRPATTVRRL